MAKRAAYKVREGKGKDWAARAAATSCRKLGVSCGLHQHEFKRQ